MGNEDLRKLLDQTFSTIFENQKAEEIQAQKDDKEFFEQGKSTLDRCRVFEIVNLIAQEMYSGRLSQHSSTRKYFDKSQSKIKPARVVDLPENLLSKGYEINSVDDNKESSYLRISVNRPAVISQGNRVSIGTASEQWKLTYDLNSSNLFDRISGSKSLNDETRYFKVNSEMGSTRDLYAVEDLLIFNSEFNFIPKGNQVIAIKKTGWGLGWPLFISELGNSPENVLKNLINLITNDAEFPSVSTFIRNPLPGWQVSLNPNFDKNSVDYTLALRDYGLQFLQNAMNTLDFRHFGVAKDFESTYDLPYNLLSQKGIQFNWAG